MQHDAHMPLVSKNTQPRPRLQLSRPGALECPWLWVNLRALGWQSILHNRYVPFFLVAIDLFYCDLTLLLKATKLAIYTESVYSYSSIY